MLDVCGPCPTTNVLPAVCISSLEKMPSTELIPCQASVHAHIDPFLVSGIDSARVLFRPPALWEGETVNTADHTCESLIQSHPTQSVSRRLLRYLVSGRQLGPGSRVLEIGCGTGELTRHFHRLSFDVVALDSSSKSIKTATEELPDIDFHLWHEAPDLPEAEHGYDLVLAHNLSLFGQNLSSEEVLRFTAEIASCVRPGGSLVILNRLAPTWQDQPGGHLQSCYRRLFSCFPGQGNTSTISDPFTDPRTWSWMFGRRPRSGYLAASLRIPLESISRKQWHQQALREILRPEESCCLWARRQSMIETEQRKAA